MTKTAMGSKVWMYSFDHFNPAFFEPNYPWTGAIHTMDICFQFDMRRKAFDFKRSPDDEKVTELMTGLWVHFAKTGSPRGFEGFKGLKWEPFVSPKQSPTLHILPEPFVSPA